MHSAETDSNIETARREVEPIPDPGVALHAPECCIYDGRRCSCAPVATRSDPQADAEKIGSGVY